jgi:protein phosphatase
MSIEINVGLQCAMSTDKGRRPANEDYIAVDEANGLYIVADGAGGKAGGRTAATLAAKTTMEALAGQVQGLDSAQTTSAIDEAVQNAHQRIKEAQAAQPELHRMSTTLALAVHRGDRLHYTHVGDSRIYLYRNSALRQLSRDHSLKNHLEDNPHVRRPVQMSDKTLVRAIGISGKPGKPVKADHDHLTLERNDMILLCTDGLTDTVPPWIMGEILGGAPVVSIDDVATSLVRAALRYGSTDNVSVIVLRAVELTGEDVRTKVHEPEPSLGVKLRVPRLGWLVHTDGPKRGELIRLEKSNTVGINPGCMIRFEDNFMSDQHAEIFLTKHGYVLRDLGSTNGTFINNIRVKEECLVDGDVVRFGTTSVVFKCYRDRN